MKTGIAALAGLMLLGSLVGCSSGGYRDSSAYDMTAKSPSPSAGEAPLHTAARQPGAQRSVIHTASMGVNVDDIKAAEKSMRKIVDDSGGYIVHLEGQSLAGKEPVLSVTVRVPEKQFDAAMVSLEAMGVANYKTVSATDVTEQILDLEASLKQLNRDRSVLVNGGSGTNLNPGYESMQDRIRQLSAQRDELSGRASMSTIDLVIAQKPGGVITAANASWGKDTWNAALSSALGAFRVLGAAAIWLFVYSPIWGAALFGLIWAHRVSRRRIGAVGR